MGDGGGPDGANYYVELTVASASVGATLSNYPVYVDLSGLPADFWTNVQSDGGDIRVTESDGTTRCPAELVAIDTGTETGVLHFKAATIDSGSDTTFRIYYGSGTGTMSQPAVGDTNGRNAVWSDYAAVLHLNTDPTAALVDSTGNGNDGTSRGSMTSGDVVAGLLGDALDLDGTDDAIELPSINAAAITVELIAKFDSFNAGSNVRARIASKNSGGSGSNGFWIVDTYDGGAGGEDGLRFGIHLDGSFRTATAGAGTLTTTDRHSVAGTYDGTTLHAYRDGTSVASTAYSGTIPNNAQAVTIGEDNPEGSVKEYVDGQVEEFRLRAEALSGDWLAAQYTNHHDPATFYSVGTQQAA